MIAWWRPTSRSATVSPRLIDYVPATEPGWDSRTRHGEEVLVKTGQIPPDA
jgi:hypothetical protein